MFSRLVSIYFLTLFSSTHRFLVFLNVLYFWYKTLRFRTLLQCSKYLNKSLKTRKNPSLNTPDTMTNAANPKLLPFEIKTSKFEGRYITSPIDSDAGKVCFDDKPLVHVTVSQEYCAFCLKRFARVGDKKGDTGKTTKNNNIKCDSTAKGLLDFVSCVCGREFYCNIQRVSEPKNMK